MKIKSIKPTWLTSDLKKEIRKSFEPRYNRPLEESELLEIADSLTMLIEVYSKNQYRKNAK